MGLRIIIQFINKIFIKITFSNFKSNPYNVFAKVFIGWYYLASNTRDSETIFKNVCSSYQFIGREVVTKGTKLFKLSDLDQKGIADL